jgi:hypothetical protein
MSLSNILKEIETNRSYAEMDVTMSNEATFRNRLGLKNAAMETIRRLKVNYKDELTKSTSFIVVTGPGRDQFAQLASSETFGCFVVDSDEFYKDLSARISPPSIKPSLFERENIRNLFNVAQNVLRDKAIELGVESYPPLFFNEKYNLGVNTVEEFLPIIKAAINDQVGSEMVGVSAIHSIVDGAIKRGHAAVVTPVILNTADEKFALDLEKNLKKHVLPDGTYRGMTENVFLVIAGKAPKGPKLANAVYVKEVTEQTVGEALTTIRNKISL